MTALVTWKWLPCKKGQAGTDHGQGTNKAPGENHGEPECEFSSTPHSQPYGLMWAGHILN